MRDLIIWPVLGIPPPLLTIPRRSPEKVGVRDEGGKMVQGFIMKKNLGFPDHADRNAKYYGKS
jgi:hypothetical protein